MILQVPDIPDPEKSIEALDRSRAMTFILELLAKIPDWAWAGIVIFIMVVIIIKVWRKVR